MTSEVVMHDEDCVWVFIGEGARLPSAVFRSLKEAEAWISSSAVSGVLTAYPLGESTYDWSIRRGYFAPKRKEQSAPEFIQKFSSGSQEHFHFVNGKRPT